MFFGSARGRLNGTSRQLCVNCRGGRLLAIMERCDLHLIICQGVIALNSISRDYVRQM